MPTQEDEVFAKLAVKNRLLSQKHADACLKLLESAERDGRKRTLSQVAIERKYISAAQANAVSFAVQHTLTKAKDRHAIKLLLARKWATQAHINTALAKQAGVYKNARQSISVIDILIHSRLLTRERASEVVHEAEKAAHRGGGDKNRELEAQAAEDGVKLRKLRSAKVAIQPNELPSGRVVTTIAVAGSLDTDSCNEMQQVLADLFAEGDETGKYIILNLEGVHYISSSGVGIVVSASKGAEEKGGAFVLSNPSKEVKEVLDLVGLTETFKPLPPNKAMKKLERA